MKNSGVEWIGEIPEDWEVKKVKHSFVRKNEKAMQENPTVLSLARSGVKERDISNNEGQLAESYYNYNPVDVDDLLINPMDLYSGANCSISKVKGVISPAYINLRAKKNVSPVFYDYYFKVQYWMMAFFAHGNGVSFENRWTLNNETLQNYPIVAPNFETQQRIASYLDKKCNKIEETIQNQQQVIEKLKAYKQSLITEAVTGKVKIENGKVCGKYENYKDSGVEWIGKIPSEWETPKIQYIATISSGTTPNRSQPKYWNGDVNWIKTGELQNNRLFEVEEKITQTAVEECSLQILPLNSVLIAMYGQGKTRGMTALLKTPSTTNQACAALIVNSKKLSSDFLWHCLIGAYNAIRANAEGSGQPNLNSENIKKFHITLPSSIEEQECICNYLDKKCTAIDTAIEQKQNLVEKLTEYKKSLIYECVTGKKEI